jgi:hypothetical protein
VRIDRAKPVFYGPIWSGADANPSFNGRLTSVLFLGQDPCGVYPASTGNCSNCGLRWRNLQWPDIYRGPANRLPRLTWRTFLTNHLAQTAAIDFFTVPTATFRVLFVLVVLSHERRRVLHFGVTEHPTQEWTVQQMREAFPWDEAPRFVLRDRDAIYGRDFAAMTRDRRVHPSAGSSCRERIRF